jgi:hypothetical protein
MASDIPCLSLISSNVIVRSFLSTTALDLFESLERLTSMFSRVDLPRRLFKKESHTRNNYEKGTKSKEPDKELESEASST